MTTQGLVVLTLAGYAASIWIAYEIMKASIKDALRELRAADKAQAEKEAKIQD
mgnify:CR=1 FL=1|tara:strand:- start:150 stop:308 length:159 start_codon:yes stop_codon:yes gene_type:complete